MAHMNDHHFNYYSSHSSCGGHETNHDNFQEFTDQALYESDEFRMYIYKIKKCVILRCHDWTSCPFTHRGEKARRRDPRQYNYLPIPCPSYKFALCLKGDNCNLCHGVFEYWLHPAKYRTHLCYAGMACERQVCFFAHTLKELRPETKYNCCYVYQYPLDTQSYPNILIENEPNGNWMIISCNPQLPSPPNDQAGLGNSSIPQQISQKNTSTFVLFVSSHPSSSQSQPKTYQRVQNEDDFLFFSVSHVKLAEELRNLEIESTSHGKVNKIYDEKGKRLLEFESQNQEFSNVNWVSDLLVDEFEGRR